jgi:diguanylate cyclase (GGDEF)-like protein/PAS domain S-box-containing protein
MSTHTPLFLQHYPVTVLPDPVEEAEIPLDPTLLATLVRSAEDAIFSTTLQGVVTSWNPGAARLFGYSAGQMLGMHTTLPFFPDRLAEKDAILARLRSGESIAPFFTTQLRRDGAAVQVLLSLFLLKDGASEPVGLGVIARAGARCSDVVPCTMTSAAEAQAIDAQLAEANERLLREVRHATEQSEALEVQKLELERANRRLEEMNVQLETLATTDSLTGLKNHRLFQERLIDEVRRAARYGSPLSILMLDIDQFKTYNDAFGHPAGDALLRRLAGEMEATVRSSDLPARYGGEEFAVILPETDAEQARIAAERLRAAIESMSCSGWSVTASFGVATLSPSVPDAVTLISQADEALYRSKRIGRNCVTHALDIDRR